MAETPQSCTAHQGHYKSQAWEMYSLAELGQWVHLFAKRAAHRSHLGKRERDLTDAQNYLNMMQSKLDEEKQSLFALKVEAMSNPERRAEEKLNQHGMSLNAKREADLQAIRDDLNDD